MTIESRIKIIDFEEEKTALEMVYVMSQQTQKYDVCQPAMLAYTDSDSKEDDIDRYDRNVLCDAIEDYEKE